MCVPYPSPGSLHTSFFKARSLSDVVLDSVIPKVAISSLLGMVPRPCRASFLQRDLWLQAEPGLNSSADSSDFCSWAPLPGHRGIGAGTLRIRFWVTTVTEWAAGRRVLPWGS